MSIRIAVSTTFSIWLDKGDRLLFTGVSRSESEWWLVGRVLLVVGDAAEISNAEDEEISLAMPSSDLTFGFFLGSGEMLSLRRLYIAPSS